MEKNDKISFGIYLSEKNSTIIRRTIVKCMNVKIYLNISHTLLRVCEDEINWSYDCIQTDQDLKIDLLVGEGRKQRSGESGAGGRCQLHPGRWMSFTRSSLLNAQFIFDQHIGVCSVKSVGRTPIK